MKFLCKACNKFFLLLCAVALVVGCEEASNAFGPKVGVGDYVPGSQNRIVSNTQDWHQVSSMDTMVPLYKWRISDLLEKKKPFLVVFGTPQHCTMCVDQIVRVAVMEEKYGDEFAFIHIDGYRDNPVWVEWGIKGEPWTFVVNGKGKVVKLFPGQTELALLEEIVLELLGKNS